MVTEDHVAVAVTVAGCTEAVVVSLEEKIRQIMGVSEVWIRMPAAEIFKWNAIAHAARWCCKQILEHTFGVWPRDGMHRVKGQREIAAQQTPDLIEIEQLLHQCHKVIDTIDDLNLHGTDVVCSWSPEIQLGSFNNGVLLQ